MVKDAEVNAANDKAEHEKIEAKNKADQAAYQAEKEKAEGHNKSSQTGNINPQQGKNETLHEQQDGKDKPIDADFEVVGDK
jgi:molecular chaperone DnaK (HSP70)